MNSTLDRIGQRLFVGDRVAWIDPDDGTSATAVGIVTEIDEFRRVRLNVEVLPGYRFGLASKLDADDVIVIRSQPPHSAPAGRN